MGTHRPIRAVDRHVTEVTGGKQRGWFVTLASFVDRATAKFTMLILSVKIPPIKQSPMLRYTACLAVGHRFPVHSGFSWAASCVQYVVL